MKTIHILPVILLVLACPVLLAEKWIELLNQSKSDFLLTGQKAKNRIQEHFSLKRFIDNYSRVFL
tara:strand:+ start:1545 stop:1739 length:195 start_codon:yes stop_codon:yes gene_type:complete